MSLLKVFKYASLAFCSVVISCGKFQALRDKDGALPVNQVNVDGFVLKSRIEIVISRDIHSGASVTQLAAAGNPVAIPVSVTNAPDASMSVDLSAFIAPKITSGVLSFGNIKITDLRDNNLKSCGVDGKTKCGVGVIRIYTTGTTGAGFYNSADKYGAPVTAGLAGATAGTVGLEAANATIVQQLKLDLNKNVIKFSDWTPAPTYQINADFSNAGSGSYSTTLVVEYGLLP